MAFVPPLALFDGHALGQRDVGQVLFALDRSAGIVEDVHAIAGDFRGVTVLQVDHPARGLHDCGHVGGDEVLALSQPDPTGAVAVSVAVGTSVPCDAPLPQPGRATAYMRMEVRVIARSSVPASAIVPHAAGRPAPGAVTAVA